MYVEHFARLSFSVCDFLEELVDRPSNRYGRGSTVEYRVTTHAQAKVKVLRRIEFLEEETCVTGEVEYRQIGLASSQLDEYKRSVTVGKKNDNRSNFPWKVNDSHCMGSTEIMRG